MSQFANSWHLHVCLRFLSSVPNHPCSVSSREKLSWQWSQKDLLGGRGVKLKTIPGRNHRIPKSSCFWLSLGCDSQIYASSINVQTHWHWEHFHLVVLPWPPIQHIQELTPFSLTNLDRPLFHMPVLVRVTAVSCSPNLEILALSISLPCLPSPLYYPILSVRCLGFVLSSVSSSEQPFSEFVVHIKVFSIVQS